MANFNDLSVVKQYVASVLAKPVRRGYLIAPANIPAELKARKQWVCWVVGKTKPNGKFDKVPVDPNTGRYIDGTKPQNWLQFEEALAGYEAGKCDGIGIGLSPEPFLKDEEGAQYLIAIDLDDVADRLEEIKAIWKSLKKPYTEISPSGKGLRMFALSRKPLNGGNDGNGHEMYSSGRFVTVTGNVIGGHHD